MKKLFDAYPIYEHEDERISAEQWTGVEIMLRFTLLMGIMFGLGFMLAALL